MDYRSYFIVGLTVFLVLLMIVLVLDEKRKRLNAEDALAVNLRQTQEVATITGQLVQEVETGKASSAQLMAMSDSIFNLQKDKKDLIKQVSRLSIELQHARLKEPIVAGYTDTVEIIGDCDSLIRLAVITPAPFQYLSDSISLSGTVLLSGVRLDDIYIPDTLFTRDVTIKTGFLNLGRKQYTQIYHSNSLFRTDSAQVLKVDMKPSWWHRTGKPAAAFTLGAAATYFLLSSLKQ